jgi:hypothetical protein
MTGRFVLRTVAVVLLALIGIAFSVSDIVLPWHPYGVVGVVFARPETVVSVTPKSQAAQAGIRVGDRVDFRAMSPIARANFNGVVLFGAVGARYTLPIVAPSGVRRLVTVGVDVPPRTPADNVTDVIQCLSYFVSIALAAALVMVRPSRVTWSFFIFVLLSTVIGATPTTFGIPAISGLSSLLNYLEKLSWIPLAIFALRFPHDAPGKTPRAIERVLLASLVVFLPLVFFVAIDLLVPFGVPFAVQAGKRFLRVLPTFGLLFAAAMFALDYRAATPPDRTRMRWVIAGFLVGYSGIVGRQFLFTHDYVGTLWINNLLASTPVFGTIAVTYAIVRHRVLDIRIVVRRAAVYAVLTTCVVALIAVMDFLVSKVFAGTKLAAIGEIGVAVILGLALNPLHRRLEIVVDAAIFRWRRAGQERLRLVADGLLHANEASSISVLLVNESTEAFRLASAALFEAGESGDYALAASVGWDGASRRSIEHDSSLVLRLIAAGAPLRLTPVDLAALIGVPDNSQAPALAVPIIFRGELDGFMLVGAHRSGEEIDAEEIVSLSALARSAASAYDHLDAQAMRAWITTLQATGVSAPVRRGWQTSS